MRELQDGGGQDVEHLLLLLNPGLQQPALHTEAGVVDQHIHWFGGRESRDPLDC